MKKTVKSTSATVETMVIELSLMDRIVLNNSLKDAKDKLIKLQEKIEDLEDALIKVNDIDNKHIVVDILETDMTSVGEVMTFVEGLCKDCTLQSNVFGEKEKQENKNDDFFNEEN